MKNLILMILMPCVMGVTDRFVVEIKDDIREVKDVLRSFNFVSMFSITNTVYSFKYEGNPRQSKMDQVLSEIRKVLDGKIVKIEHAKEYSMSIPIDLSDIISVASGQDDNNTWIPIGRSHILVVTILQGQDDRQIEKYNESKNYFGMNVEKAWSKGYNGSGVIVAVVDVGVNADTEDLKNNLDMTMAKNFITNTTDVTPEEFPNYPSESKSYVNHGNRCTSIIAAEKDNDKCNAGIAYGSKVVSLKAFSVKHEYYRFKVHFTSDAVAAALSYGIDTIDIYSNSWTFPKSFEPLSMDIKAAVLKGTTQGRKGLGSVYVVPDGSDGITGSGLANSIYTIAVNNVGVHGTLPTKPLVSACVLTSGLGEGNRLHTNKMMTSSSGNMCTDSFKGVSAAVAEVSAIIALGLNARKDLSLRDIQHLCVESSDRQMLKVARSFTRNAAGKFFNPFLGFGLVDADKFVTLSKTWKHVGRMYQKTLTGKNIVKLHTSLHKYGYRVHKVTNILFEMAEDACNPHVNTIEQVVLHIDHNVIKKANTLIEIDSPSHTASLVVDNTDITNFSDGTDPRDLSSVHFWGEHAYGDWKVRIRHGHAIGIAYLNQMTLTLYGTFNESKRKLKCQKQDNESTMTPQTTKAAHTTAKKSGKGKSKSLAIRHTPQSLFVYFLNIVFIIVCSRF